MEGGAKGAVARTQEALQHAIAARPLGLAQADAVDGPHGERRRGAEHGGAVAQLERAGRGQGEVAHRSGAVADGHDLGGRARQGIHPQQGRDVDAVGGSEILPHVARRRATHACRDALLQRARMLQAQRAQHPGPAAPSITSNHCADVRALSLNVKFDQALIFGLVNIYSPITTSRNKKSI